ncbi:MAG: N-6 DNA methylase [bacterium]
MLDTETKRRIDTARDILVGKVPDPKSQVEQITIALIYKFMDDMDKESVELGGKPKFFTREYNKFAWSKIFDPKIGGFELVNIYGEAIQRMNQNPNIPQLFRDMFKNAYLPYRDPETLKSFLKIINDFKYDNSERLGDAFEYLLSVLGSQGEAGQFRTPRHIIDLMIEIINPQKSESILDPACGTAGFLISSYKHILKYNSENYDPEKDLKAFELHGVKLDEITINNKKYKGDKLSSDDRKRLAENITGYDISPDMVRLSLVNMYLHGFSNPKISEYDTLTSEAKWNEFADVIMANPPFMSPKGGIRPHKRFSIEASRSEVLFVDYIAEHLTPQGRAAVIVPEGIIFQSQTSHKDLRKMLIEKNYLVGVISLPAGVFNPYSGVKTSILWMDRILAKKTDKIIFIKIENDGFNLGAQRRPIKENDLPEAYRAILAYKEALISGKKFNADKWENVLVVEKGKIEKNGGYNLSGERYAVTKVYSNVKWPMVELGKVCDLYQPQTITSKEILETGPYKVFGANGVIGYFDKYNHEDSEVLITCRGATCGTVNLSEPKSWITGNAMVAKPKDKSKINKAFLFYFLKNSDFYSVISGAAQPQITRQSLSPFRIPLPPLSVQQEIVAEINSYQKITDGARQVVENYKPRIDIDPDWPVVELVEAPLEIIDGDRGVNYPKQNEFQGEGYCLFLNTKNVRENGFRFDETMFISQDKDKRLGKGKLKKRDVVLTSRGTVGNTGIFDDNVPFRNIRINSGMLIFRPDESKILSEYLFYFFQSINAKDQIKKILSGSAQPQLPIKDLNHLVIPLPNLKVQKQIVEQIRKEQEIVKANKQLIRIFEQKIKGRIAKVWGEK